MLQTDAYVYASAPLLVYWEITQSCPLSCAHCRAAAIRERHPAELTYEEGCRLIDQVREFGARPPHLVITGGDPLQRPDLVDLVRYAGSVGVATSVTPAGTPELTRERLAQLIDAGASGFALSLDDSEPEAHDAFRGEPGSFAATLRGIRDAVALAAPVQVNTMVTASTAAALPDIYALLRDLGVARWALFFLVQTGRGSNLEEVSPVEGERLLRWLAGLAREAPFPIKTTEAHHYRRVVWRGMKARGASDEAIRASPAARGFGVRDGNGVVFVSHTGQVFPSGFLPLSVGNVRQTPLRTLYREAPLMRRLRDANGLTGKCGRCELRWICGGSRARAHAATGNPLASDPLCPYEPHMPHGTQGSAPTMSW